MLARRLVSAVGHIASLAVALGLLGAAFHPAGATHAAVGTPIPNAQMPLLGGGRESALADVEASVLVFFRPNQERSTEALRELADCLRGFDGKSVRWVGIVSESAPPQAVTELVREAGFGAPVLVDGGDALYGALGLALHPVVVIAGRNHKLAAFEPFRSIDFCSVVRARIRHVLGEISDEELRVTLNPPKAVEGGNGQVARRYRAFAEALFRAKNYDKALENVQKSIERTPSASAHSLHAEILAAQAKCGEALAAHEQAVALDAAAKPGEGVERCKAAR